MAPESVHLKQVQLDSNDLGPGGHLWAEMVAAKERITRASVAADQPDLVVGEGDVGQQPASRVGELIAVTLEDWHRI